MRRRFLLLPALLLLAAGGCSAVRLGAQRRAHAEVAAELLSAKQAVSAGRPIEVVLSHLHDLHGHVAASRNETLVRLEVSGKKCRLDERAAEEAVVAAERHVGELAAESSVARAAEDRAEEEWRHTTKLYKSAEHEHARATAHAQQLAEQKAELEQQCAERQQELKGLLHLIWQLVAKSQGSGMTIDRQQTEDEAAFSLQASEAEESDDGGDGDDEDDDDDDAQPPAAYIDPLVLLQLRSRVHSALGLAAPKSEQHMSDISILMTKLIDRVRSALRASQQDCAARSSKLADEVGAVQEQRETQTVSMNTLNGQVEDLRLAMNAAEAAASSKAAELAFARKEQASAFTAHSEKKAECAGLAQELQVEQRTWAEDNAAIRNLIRWVEQQRDRKLSPHSKQVLREVAEWPPLRASSASVLFLSSASFNRTSTEVYDQAAGHQHSGRIDARGWTMVNGAPTGGQAVLLPSASSLILPSDHETSLTTANWTLSVWADIASGVQVQDYDALAERQAGDLLLAPLWSLSFAPGRKLLMQLHAAPERLSKTVQLTTDELLGWHLWTIVKRGAAIRFYLDAAQLKAEWRAPQGAAFASKLPAADSGAAVMGELHVCDEGLVCAVDLVEVADRPLTEDEINRRFRMGETNRAEAVKSVEA